jgi:hypothetical protein
MTDQRTPFDAKYIASMCNSLSKMARAQGYELGAYLLEMACLEFTQLHEIAERKPALGKHP